MALPRLDFIPLWCFRVCHRRVLGVRQRHFDEQKDADDGRQHRGRSRRRVAAAAATAGQAAVLAWWTGRRGRGVDGSTCVGRQCYRLHLVLRRLRFTHGGRQSTSSHRRRRRPLPQYLASMLVETTDRRFGGQQVKDQGHKASQGPDTKYIVVTNTTSRRSYRLHTTLPSEYHVYLMLAQLKVTGRSHK